MGEAGACCEVEDVTGKDEWRHSSDSVQADVSVTELRNPSVVIFAPTLVTCFIHELFLLVSTVGNVITILLLIVSVCVCFSCVFVLLQKKEFIYLPDF